MNAVMHRSMQKRDWIILSVLLAMALILRMYKITIPLADWHSWRQADTMAVSRNYLRTGIDMLHPHYDDFSNVQSGQYNPNGYRFVEFPLYNILTSLTAKAVPHYPIEIYGRLISIIMSLLLIISVYVLMSEYENRTSAIIAGLFLAIFPYSVYYSRAALPDMTALTLGILSILFLHVWSSRSKKYESVWYGVSLVLFACALLVKPTTIFFGLPLLYIHYRRYGTDVLKKLLVYAYFLISIVPFLLWRSWIVQFPEGIPVSAWLFTSINGAGGRTSIFLRPAFFRWIFLERILQLITGGFAGLFVVLGSIHKSKKGAFMISLGLAALIYLFVFEGGNVQHDYYQIMILPALAGLMGVGVSMFVASSKDTIPAWLKWPFVCIFLALSWYFSFYEVSKYYEINGGIVNAARIVRTLTPSTSLIATDTTGDTTLLYLSDRKGFPSLADTPDGMAKRGISYLVTFNSDYAHELAETYKLVFENDSLFILKLN